MVFCGPCHRRSFKRNYLSELRAVIDFCSKEDSSRLQSACGCNPQVVIRTIRGRIHVRNTLQQLELVGPRSLGVSLLTASFVGMVFTIQVCLCLCLSPLYTIDMCKIQTRECPQKCLQGLIAI